MSDMSLIPHSHPTHNAAADHVAQGMFTVFVVQRVKGGDRYFGVRRYPTAAVSCQNLYAQRRLSRYPDNSIRRDRAEWAKKLEGVNKWVRSRPDIINSCLAAQAVVPLASQPGVLLPGRTTPSSDPS